MPLLRIDGETGLKKEGAQPILVFSDHGRSMGLVVDEIVDIVEDKLDIEVASDRPGVLGYAVVKGNTTEIIDVGHFLPQAFEDWFRRRDRGAARPARTVLLVDDSAFFRNMLAPLIKAAGYQVDRRRFGLRTRWRRSSPAPRRPRRDRRRNAGHGRLCARPSDARRAGHRSHTRSSRWPRWFPTRRSSAVARSASTISSPSSTGPG